MSVPRVTATMLRRLGACSDQVATVEREWPNGAPVTVATVRKAYRLGLDVDWLANKVLPALALAEYQRVTAAWLAAALRAALKAGGGKDEPPRTG